MTKVHLVKMCLEDSENSSSHIEILIPALEHILKLGAAREASSSPSLTGSECANIASIQEHVVRMNEGLLKNPGSLVNGSRLPTPHPLNLSRAWRCVNTELQQQRIEGEWQWHTTLQYYLF